MKQYILTSDNLPEGVFLDEQGYATILPRRSNASAVVLNEMKLHCQQYANKMIEYYSKQLAEANSVMEPFINGLYDSLDEDIAPSYDDIFTPEAFNAKANFFFCPELSEEKADAVMDKISNGFGLNTYLNLIQSVDINEEVSSRIPFTIDNTPAIVEVDGISYKCICIKRHDGLPYQASDILIAYGIDDHTVWMNKYIHRSDVDYDLSNIIAEDWVAVNDVIKAQMDNNTVLDMFQYIASCVTQAIARGKESVDLTMLQGYIENQCGGQLDAVSADALTEIQSAVTQDPSPSGVLQYLIRKMRESCGSTSGSSSILTNNNSFVTKSLSSGILKGVALTASAIATVVGVALGGVFGAAIAVVSSVASTLLTTTKQVADEVTYARYATNVVANDLFPVGLCQYVMTDTNLAVHPGLDQTGVGSVATPCFEIFSHIQNVDTNLVEQEVHISAAKIGLSGLSSILSYNTSNGRVSWSLNSTPSIVRDAMLTEKDSNIIKYSGDEATTDKAFRKAYITGLAYFLTSILCSGNSGASRLYISLDADNDLEASIAMFLSACLQHDIDDTIWDQITWSNITGSSGSGALGIAVEKINHALMTTEWYQTKTIIFGDKTFSQKYLILTTDASVPSSITNTTGFVASYSMPYTSIVLPIFERTTFWMDVASTIAGIVLTAIAAFAISIVVKNKIRQYNTIQTAKVESAWSKLSANPTSENAKAYNKLVKKHNKIARFTGGTVYSRTNYWGDASSSNDTIRANITDYSNDFKEIKDGLSLVNLNITGSPTNNVR